MPVIAALIAALLIGFWFGQGTNEPPDKGYEVIVDEKRVVERVTVPGDMPASCRKAAELLPRLVDDLEGIDVATGDLNQLAFELATFAEQPGGQTEINKRIMEANKLQEEVARASMPALATSQEYSLAAEACDQDLNTG